MHYETIEDLLIELRENRETNGGLGMSTNDVIEYLVATGANKTNASWVAVKLLETLRTIGTIQQSTRPNPRGAGRPRRYWRPVKEVAP